MSIIRLAIVNDDDVRRLFFVRLGVVRGSLSDFFCAYFLCKRANVSIAGCLYEI